MQTREAAAQRQQLVASESAKPLGPALRIPPRPVGGVLLFADRRKKKLPEGSFFERGIPINAAILTRYARRHNQIFPYPKTCPFAVKLSAQHRQHDVSPTLLLFASSQPNGNPFVR